MLVPFKLILLLSTATAAPSPDVTFLGSRAAAESSFTLPLVSLTNSTIALGHDKRGDMNLIAGGPQFGLPLRVGANSAAPKDLLLIMDTGSPFTVVDTAIAGDLAFTNPMHKTWGEPEAGGKFSLKYQGNVKFIGQYFKNRVSFDGFGFTQPFRTCCRSCFTLTC